MNKKRLLGTLALIILVGTFLRFYKLGTISFVADEFLDINAAYGYFKTGEWQAWDFNLGQPAERINVASDERAWLYRWQVAQIFNYLPPTEATARAISALWGILTIAALYLVTTSFTKNRAIGVISSFLFAVSVSGIIFDRHLRMYAMFFPVFMIFSWSVFKLLEEKYAGKNKFLQSINERVGLNAIYLVPACLIGLLSFHLHQLTGNIVLVGIIYLAVLAVRHYKKDKLVLSKYAIFLLVGLVGFVLIKLIKPEIIASLAAGLVFFTNHPSYFIIILRDYSHPIVALILIASGFYYLFNQKKTEKEALWLLISLLTILLAAVFIWRRNVGEQYIFFAQSFVIILMASGIYWVAEFCKNNLAKFKEKAFYVPVILLLLIVPNYAYFFAENNTYRQTSRSENPNYRKVFEYFKKNRNISDVLITRDFRNYYYGGQKVKVFDFGGEVSKDKLTLEDVKSIMAENKTGWIIFSNNDEDYISKEARDFMAENLEKINAIAVRGDINVYRWISGN